MAHNYPSQQHPQEHNPFLQPQPPFTQPQHQRRHSFNPELQLAPQPQLQQQSRVTSGPEWRFSQEHQERHGITPPIPFKVESRPNSALGVGGGRVRAGSEVTSTGFTVARPRAGSDSGFPVPTPTPPPQPHRHQHQQQQSSLGLGQAHTHARQYSHSSNPEDRDRDLTPHHTGTGSGVGGWGKGNSRTYAQLAVDENERDSIDMGRVTLFDAGAEVDGHGHGRQDSGHHHSGSGHHHEEDDGQGHHYPQPQGSGIGKHGYPLSSLYSNPFETDHHVNTNTYNNNGDHHSLHGSIRQMSTSSLTTLTVVDPESGGAGGYEGGGLKDGSGSSGGPFGSSQFPKDQPYDFLPAHPTTDPAQSDEEKEFLISYSPTDPLHPYSWTFRKKWLILIIICSASLCVTATSSIQSSTYNSLMREFRVEKIVVVLGVSLYVLGFGVGALFLGPLSEFFGRRIIYLVSFALFTVFNIPIATATNIGVLLFFRFVTGLCGSGFLSVAGGSVSDLFPPGQTDIPVAIYTLSPLIGPCVGPLIGGFINWKVSWRVTFYTVIGWSAAEFVLLFFLVPETFLPIVLKNEAYNKRVKTGIGKWHSPMERGGKKVGDVFPKALYVPVQLMVKEKMALAMDLWTSLILGIIYLFFNAIPFTFNRIYSFHLAQTGLCFIPMGLGMIIATLTQIYWVKRIKNSAALHGGKAPPEARLPVGMAGAVLVPIGLLWFSLSSYNRMTFIMPLVGTVIFGCGAVYVFTSVFGFLVSTYPKYAASAMAGNTLLRCVWAAAFPLFSDALYKGLGPSGATGLLAGMTLLMAPIPFVLYRIGPRLREVSQYSS